MTYHKSWDGLQHLANKAKGNELLGVGVRPYGLHAGNLAALVAYPYLFFENFEATHGRPPQFKFQVWLNDIEPVTYVGADGQTTSADWANMYPGSTTFQMTPAPHGFQGSLVDHWQPAIEGIVRGTIGVRFPHVKLEFRRASELVVTPQFENMITHCIRRAVSVRNKINRWNRFVAKVAGADSFVWPLCPTCRAPLIHPKVVTREGIKLITVAEKHSHGHEAIDGLPVKDLFWAVQFRMLHTARLAKVQPKIWFMGMDHVPTNMGYLLYDLANKFEIRPYGGTFLHAPLLFANGDKKLSKSLGNAVYVPIPWLIEALRNNKNMGLDVTHAPVSSDILAIGSELLPPHIRGNNQEERIAFIRSGMMSYDESGRPSAFRNDNLDTNLTLTKVAKMLGVPHI